MRIFEFQMNGEKEWIAADTIIAAIQTHSSITSMDLAEYDCEDDIVEIPKEKWSEYNIVDSEAELPNITFEEWMQTHNKPDMIATTVC